MTDLDALIAAVEAGDATDFRALLTDSDDPAERAKRCGWASGAYKGRLDAAHRLHEALLPEWVTRHNQAAKDCWHFYVKPHISDDENPLRFREFMGIGSPARAWLLAILRALKAQGETK